MRDLIVSGLILPLRLYLQPRAVHEQIGALTVDGSEDYRDWNTLPELRMPTSRRGLLQVVFECVFAWLLWSPLLMLIALGALSAMGYEVDWMEAGSGMASGLGTGMGIGVAVGLTAGVANGVAVAVASLALGLGWAIGDALPGGHASLIGSVAAGAGMGLAFDMATGMWFEGQDGKRLGLARRVLWSLVIGIAAGVPIGLASVEAGTRTGLAASVTFLVMSTHVINLPLEYVGSLASWVLVRISPRLSAALWRLSPVRWDEVILLPLPGLIELLVTLYRSDSAQGHDALTDVAAHRYQHRAAHKALVQLANEEARLVTSAPALAAFHRGLAWLSDDVPLPDEVRYPVFAMRDVSREVASALESDSATNRVRRLEAAADLLWDSRILAGVFGPAQARWSAIVTVALEDAQRQQRIEEPIPQVYISGNPIRPAHRPELAVPFKGRGALFRQLETSLGDGEGQRATLLLYGQRRTGKTSVLLHLPRRLGSRVVPAFVDLQNPKLSGSEDVAGLLRGLADEVVDEARRHRGVNLPALDPTALTQDPYPALGRWLDQVETELDERTLLLCLDEFEALEHAIQDGRLDRRILDTLRSVVQHRQRIAVLLSGSHQIHELSTHWASALITTQTLSISFLEHRDARELITEPVEGFPAIYTPAAVARILRTTHCQPYLVQLVCALLVERMNTARRMPPDSYVEAEDVEAIIPLVLRQGENYFLDLWDNQTGSEAARRVLEALAREPLSEADSAKLEAVVQDADALRAAVGTLLRREIVERTDGGYRITVPLIAEYIRQRVLV